MSIMMLSGTAAMAHPGLRVAPTGPNQSNDLQTKKTPRRGPPAAPGPFFLSVGGVVEKGRLMCASNGHPATGGLNTLTDYQGVPLPDTQTTVRDGADGVVVDEPPNKGLLTLPFVHKELLQAGGIKRFSCVASGTRGLRGRDIFLLIGKTFPYCCAYLPPLFLSKP